MSGKSLAVKLVTFFTLAYSTFCLAETDCIDELAFGDPNSESQHAVVSVNSSTGTGGLGQSYRKLLNYSPYKDYGVGFRLSYYYGPPY